MSSYEYMKEWRQNNPEKVAAHAKTCYEKNKPRMQAAHKLYYENNREERIAYSKRWTEENHEKRTETVGKWYMENSTKIREDNYKRNYGITLDEYNSMFDSQFGSCYICGRHQTELKKTLAVDHCHITGKVRKLLCGTCNTHLGIFEKYKEVFENYLQENK